MYVLVLTAYVLVLTVYVLVLTVYVLVLTVYVLVWTVHVLVLTDEIRSRILSNGAVCFSHWRDTNCISFFNDVTLSADEGESSAWIF